MASTSRASSSIIKFPETKRVSLFLILFRWVALLVVFVFLYQDPGRPEFGGLRSYVIFSLVFLYTILVSYFYGKGLQDITFLTKILVVVDTLFCGMLLWTTGSLGSPFFLYAFSPILTAAFFFKMSGGLAAAATVVLLYFGGLVAADYSWTRVLENKQIGDLTINILSFFLVGSFFAYPSTLLDRLLSAVSTLVKKNDNLTDINQAFEHANSQLRTLQKTSKALQSTLDLNEILEIVLAGITDGMGFEGAVLGFCDEERKVLSGWIVSNAHCRSRAAELKDLEIPLSEEGGPVAKSVIDRRPYLVGPNSRCKETFPRFLENKPFAVLPMTFQDRIVGVMLVDNHLSKTAISEKDIPVLKSIANQAAVAIENAKLIVRNQVLVIAEERNRIARDIHDGLAQSLFSIALNLQTCAKKMGDDPRGTRKKLEQLQGLASKSLKELREFIYNLPPTTLADRGLVCTLELHVDEVTKLNGLKATFSKVGRMRSLPFEVEECIYRVGQEALANVVKHAKASKVEVRLEFGGKSVGLVVADNGQGLNGKKSRVSMGIDNMRHRVESLGGKFSLEPSNGCGVCVRAKIPV